MHFKPFMLSFVDRKVDSIRLKLAFSAAANPNFAAAAFSTKKQFEFVSKYEFTLCEFNRLKSGDEIKFIANDADGNPRQEIPFFICEAVDFGIPTNNGSVINKRFLLLALKQKDKRGKDMLMLSSAGDTVEMLAPIPYSLDSRHIIPGCWLSWPVDYDIPASAYANIPKRGG